MPGKKSAWDAASQHPTYYAGLSVTAVKVLYQLKTFELFHKSESETSNACQCFRNWPQFAAVSESERMYALLLRRLVQKSRLKMGPMDRSVCHEYALQN